MKSSDFALTVPSALRREFEYVPTDTVRFRNSVKERQGSWITAFMRARGKSSVPVFQGLTSNPSWHKEHLDY
jgi:hypothetical protein